MALAPAVFMPYQDQSKDELDGQPDASRQKPSFSIAANTLGIGAENPTHQIQMLAAKQ